MDDEYEAMDAGWAHQSELEARRRQEDEALAQLRPVASRFKRECEQFERESNEALKQLRTGGL